MQGSAQLSFGLKWSFSFFTCVDFGLCLVGSDIARLGGNVQLDPGRPKAIIVRVTSLRL